MHVDNGARALAAKTGFGVFAFARFTGVRISPFGFGTGTRLCPNGSGSPNAQGEQQGEKRRFHGSRNKVRWKLRTLVAGTS